MNIKKLQKALSKKDRHFSQDLYRICADSSEELTLDFKTFNKTYSDQSGMCSYWDGVILITRKLKNLIAVDPKGNWEAHLQSIQDVLPIFGKSGSFNYQLPKKLPKEYPLIYHHFKEGKFAVKTSPGFF